MIDHFLRFRAHGLELQIPISWIDVGLEDQKFPVLQPCDVIRLMSQRGELFRLVGGPHQQPQDVESTLLEFWRRYSRPEFVQTIKFSMKAMGFHYAGQSRATFMEMKVGASKNLEYC